MRQTVLGDRYTLLEVLGGGGMGRVYLAHDNVLDREVALKVLREQYADDEGFVERFRREAKNAASLNHPSIVQVYDQGRDEGGTYYMAMEYVPGRTLKERIVEGGPLDPGEASGLGSRVAEALGVAHARGIVHRDIKSENVLLGASGGAKVADFGIARAASSEAMTETNSVWGTAAYMSPEQAGSKRVGPASDLYSLGVVLYEMLTGELPFRGGDPVATAMKHINEPAPRPKEANPAVPEALDALVVKLLAKNPEDRPAGAGELAEDLRRVGHGLPPPAAGPGERTTARMPQGAGRTRRVPAAVAPGGGPGPSASRGSRRAPLPFAALLLGTVLLGGLAWALWRGPSEQDAPGAGGVGRAEVPAVVGLPRDEATKRLAGAGLEPGSQDEAPNGEFAEGLVVEQDPEAGTEADRGTGVDLVVSTGPAREPTPPASPTASATASPANDAEPNEQREEQREAEKKASEEALKETEEAAKEAEKRREEAVKEAEKRWEEAAKKREEQLKEAEKE
jgi:serine/threonine-protein kinase